MIGKPPLIRFLFVGQQRGRAVRKDCFVRERKQGKGILGPMGGF